MKITTDCDGVDLPNAPASCDQPGLGIVIDVTGDVDDDGNVTQLRATLDVPGGDTLDVTEELTRDDRDRAAERLLLQFACEVQPDPDTCTDTEWRNWERWAARLGVAP